jgi:sugar lactone lactonase YvrE
MCFLLFALFLDYRPQTLSVPPFKHTFGFYRASKYYLQLFLGPGYDYNDPQGIAIVKLREHDNPKTKKDDDELTVFAVNSGNGQIVYNIGLEAVKVYGNKKIFSQPKGIAANEDGLIALADYGNKRVVKLQYKGGKIKHIIEIPLPGRPFDVCFDSENNLYITDFDNSKVYIYSADDSLMVTFGKQGRAVGEIYQPMGIEVIDANAPHNYHKDDFIIVTDKGGMRISKFSTRGRFVGSLQNFDIGLADAHFLYVAIDYYGSIYITDEVNDQIHKFDHNLRYIISVGRTGADQGEFVSPRGISIWRRYGQVFISEKEGGQYLWIAADGFVVGCFPKEFSQEHTGTTLAIYTTEDAKIYITVHNQLGEKVRDLIGSLRRPPGEFLVVWDGRDNNDQLVSPGEYEFHITLKALHGLSRRVNKELKAGVTCTAL